MEERFNIPVGYGDHRVVLMVKDPWWLYAYWEIQPGVERQVRSRLEPEEVSGLRSVLRVYDVTDLPAAPLSAVPGTAQAGHNFPGQSANAFFDIPLSGLAMNWYIHVNAPNRSFIADLGLLTKTGRFLTLARSNRVTTPRFGPSDVLDEEWMVADENFWKLFGITAGVGMGSSPTALKELLQRNLASQSLFSPGMFSPTKIPPGRAFGLWVDTELIVYGGTDPKASVMVQGQPVKLHADGTFSVRMALPDGTQTIPVDAVSPDQQESRTITPSVTRQTDTQSSVRSPHSRVGRKRTEA